MEFHDTGLSRSTRSGLQGVADATAKGCDAVGGQPCVTVGRALAADWCVAPACHSTAMPAPPRLPFDCQSAMKANENPPDRL